MSQHANCNPHERVVFKYQLNPGLTEVELPPGSVPLHVNTQENVPYVWVEQFCNPAGRGITPKNFSTLVFATVTTGGHVHPFGKYLGTVHLTDMGMALVFHIYWLETK